MSLASDLTEVRWPVFSHLLDEALERPPTEPLSWLERLVVEHEG